MAISGAWRQRSFYVDNPEPLHTAAPEHAQAQAADPTLGAWGAPPILDETPAPYIIEQVDWVANTDGLVLDFTPTTHDQGVPGASHAEAFTGYGQVAPPADVAMAAASGRAHGLDHGADAQSSYAAPPYQAADERYHAARFEGLGAVEVAPESLTRGLNGLAVNNPDGFRRGWVDQFWVDRKLYVGERVHDARLLTPDLPYVETSQPVPEGAGPYNSPFSSMARILDTVAQRPMLRREPPPMGQGQVTDGSEDTYAAGADWVVG